MTGKRTYGEGCAAAHALDLVGERWALLVVRELVLGPKRFTDLRAGIVHASPNVLAQRLRELESAGLVRRRKLAPPASAWVYELSEWGLELESVIDALGRWGSRSPLRPREAGMSIDSLILAFKTMFDPDAADGLSATYELRLGEDRFRLEVADGELTAARGDAAGADATIEADPGVLAGVAFEGDSLDAAMRAGDMRIEGDESAARRFLTLFPLPEPAALPIGA
jgi:DNA-binding HxlR family transcriptional regulator